MLICPNVPFAYSSQISLEISKQSDAPIEATSAKASVRIGVFL